MSSAKKVDLEEQMRALGDPVRMRIVRLLALPARSRSAPDSGYCACDIAEVMGVSQSTISHHMKVLMQAGLVDGEKSGRWVYYRLREAAFSDLAACFARLARQSAACVEAGPAPGTGPAQDCGPACSAGAGTGDEGASIGAPDVDTPARRLAVVSRAG